MTKQSPLGPLTVGHEHTRGATMTVNAEADIEQGQLVVVNPIVTTARPATNGTRTAGDGLILARATEWIRQGESGTVEKLTERLSNSTTTPAIGRRAPVLFNRARRVSISPNPRNPEWLCRGGLSAPTRRVPQREPEHKGSERDPSIATVGCPPGRGPPNRYFEKEVPDEKNVIASAMSLCVVSVSRDLDERDG